MKKSLDQIDGNVMAWMAETDPDPKKKCSCCHRLEKDCQCEDDG